MPETKDVVARLREHRTALNKILRDDRLSPNRRVLAFCLSLWLDAVTLEDRQFVQRVIEGVWVDPKHVRWTDDEDIAAAESQSQLELNMVSRVKGIFSDMLTTGASAGEQLQQ